MTSPKKDANDLTFFEHIEVLRWHIIRSLISIVVFSIAVFSAKNIVFQYVILGPTSQDFVTYKFFCDLSPNFCFYPKNLQIITRDIQEQFLSHIKVSLWLGFIFSFPYIFYEFWKFIKPGLYKNEIRAARGMVFTCSFLFLFGVSFGYFLIAPVAITFLSAYSVSPEIANTTTLAALVNNMTMFTIPTGLLFEMPVIMFFLAKIGIVSAKFLSDYRKHAIVIITILSSVITPTADVFTMLLVGIPLYALYEISIIVTRRIDRERAEKELADEAHLDKT